MRRGSRRALVISIQVRHAIIRHARRERPLECCGFLLGDATQVRFAVPMRNTAASATRYRIDDAAHIGLRRLLRQFVPPLSIVGVYHSHPAGDAMPSPTDVAEAMYPEWVHLIVGLSGRTASLRAVRMSHRRVRDVAIRWR
jgi:proteasome lid subunit RPN8/RPN11